MPRYPARVVAREVGLRDGETLHGALWMAGLPETLSTAVTARSR